MLELTDIKVVRDIQKQYGFNFKKGLGQNFLCDKDTVSDIIKGSGIDKDTSVIEIGPGFGSLTHLMLPVAKKVTSIEIDEKLIPVLNDLFGEYDNFELVNSDVLKLDLNKYIDGKTAVVANLPYYITSPVITYLLEGKFNFDSITVMVQKEVAKRLTAKSGSKDYGAITLLVNYYAEASIICEVPANCFVPAPKVDSAVVKMNMLSQPSVKVKDEKLFFSLIRASFNQRRKTLLNGLLNSGLISGGKEDVKKILELAKLTELVRGETLSAEDFARLSDTIIDYQGGKYGK